MLKKQNYLQFILITGFILLFCTIYFRKMIISYFFQGEVTKISFLIDSAHAQEDIPAKKKSF